MAALCAAGAMKHLGRPFVDDGPHLFRVTPEGYAVLGLPFVEETR